MLNFSQMEKAIGTIQNDFITQVKCLDSIVVEVSENYFNNLFKDMPAYIYYLNNSKINDEGFNMEYCGVGFLIVSGTKEVQRVFVNKQSHPEYAHLFSNLFTKENNNA